MADKSEREIMFGVNPPSGDLTPEIKRYLARVLDKDAVLGKGSSTVMSALHRLAQTFVKSLQGKDHVLGSPRFKQVSHLF